MDQLEATVEGTVYRNAENGYSVVTVKPEQKIGLRTVTVVGTLPMLSGGENGHLHRGVDRASAVRAAVQVPEGGAAAPDNPAGHPEVPLQRHHPRGWRKNRAHIVNCFGEDTLKILDEHPERLQEVPNMGKKRWKQIIEDYQQQQSTRAAIGVFADVRRERVAGAENQQSVR